MQQLYCHLTEGVIKGFMKKLTDEELKKAFRYWLMKYTTRESEDPLGPFLSEKITFKYKTSSGYESYYDNLHAFMVTSKLIYRIENKWIIYGRADLGMIWKEQTRPSEPVTATSRLAFQVSPAGFSYGTALKGFCELGFGDLGFINCGLTCSF